MSAVAGPNPKFTFEYSLQLYWTWNEEQKDRRENPEDLPFVYLGDEHD